MKVLNNEIKKELSKKLTYENDIPLSYIYESTIDLRNRLSNDGDNTIYEEDHMLLNLVLDVLEVINSFIDNE